MNEANSGSVVARVYTASEAIPIEGATVVVTQRSPEGRVELLGLRTSDRSGKTEPVYVRTPGRNVSQSPSEGAGFSTVDVTADHPDFQRIIVENVQVFPGVVSLQDFAMIPLEEYPPQWGQTEVFNVTPQGL